MPDPPAPPAIQRKTWRLDVSEAVPVDGRFEIAADLIAPAAEAVRADTPLLCCLPGGFLSRRYFDLEIAGHRRYSFAEAMARAGFVSLALDHVGTGDSTKPEPLKAGYAIGVEAVADANQRALERALARLARGVDEPGMRLPPMVDPATIGVGHSMGSMLTVEQQARARPHRALVLLSFSTRGIPAFLDDASRAVAGDPARARREIGALVRRSMGSPYPARADDSEENRRAAFGVGTAPPEAEEALHAAATDLLAVGGLMSMLPGAFAPPAERVDVPVFVIVGDHDLHDDRHVRAELPRAPRVDTLVLEDSWHCHLVANTREHLFREVARWTREVLAS